MLALRQPFAADSERFRATGPDPVIPTVLGVISFGARGSMAFAIMAGLFVATMLTPLAAPVFYIMLYRAQRWPRRNPSPCGTGMG